jgi:ribonuclease P protein component
MFPKKNRISKTEFGELLKKGRAFHSPYFSLLCFKKENKEPKFAFVVSKKVARNAADRNILRRRGFSVLRDISILKEKNKWVGFFGVFFFKKEAKNLNFEDIKKEVKILLEKSGGI